ncbi:MAG: acidic ribosomal protein P0 [Thaumarchaeota archaeon CSP1-1]|nr:MAG: acidic ribosomal protein P0 [Thaumarchaeota archaeon CSP1-1]
MHENRTRYPKRKTQLYQQLQEMPTKYDVVALVRMEKVRSSQLLPLRKKFKGEVEIMSIKDKVAKKALETLDIPGIKNIIEDLTGQCLFMFTNMSPFKLNVLLGKNKILLLARAGDIASKDIVIPAKNTGVAPGPILTDFKEAGVPTKIDQGTIWITKDTTPVEKGGIISPKLATLLGKLDIKAVEAGISLGAALEKGIHYSKEDLVIDVEKFRNELTQAHQEAMALSIEAVYVTKDNVEQILAKAAHASRSVSVEAGYLTEETKEQILQKGHSQATSLSGKAKDYKPE